MQKLKDTVTQGPAAGQQQKRSTDTLSKPLGPMVVEKKQTHFLNGGNGRITIEHPVRYTDRSRHRLVARGNQS